MTKNVESKSEKKSAKESEKRTSVVRKKSPAQGTTNGSTKIKQWILFGLSIAGFLVYLVDLVPDRETHVFSQMSFRVAIVLMTMWLAFPQLEKLFQNGSSILLVGALLVTFVVTRIQLVLLAIVGFCLIYALVKYVIRIVKE